MNKLTKLALAAAILLAATGARRARASTIVFTVTGTVAYSNGTAIDPQGLDPVLTDPANFNPNLNDPWKLVLTFGTGDYTGSAGNYTLTSGTAVLTIDNSANVAGEIYNFTYGAGNYIGFNSGGSTTSLSVCTSAYCESDPSLVNYSLILGFSGGLSSPGGLPAATLTPGASPSFEFMRNFYDSSTAIGGQTELQGDVSAASAIEQTPQATPEPSTLWLLAGGLLALASIGKRLHLTPGESQ